MDPEKRWIRLWMSLCTERDVIVADQPCKKCTACRLTDHHVGAQKDIRRLMWNWLFMVLLFSLVSLNGAVVLPTNHQFIINPTVENLKNNTNQRIEPGLEESENFYSLTYTIFFLCHAVAALINGHLFNFIPTWYQSLFAIFTHIGSYVLYALTTNGWMMLVARGLAGFSVGSIVCITFSYFGTSYEKYAENLQILGKCENEKVKGYLFSTINIASILGYAIGFGFPAILSQFPETPQFRPAGWFSACYGVLVALLQIVLFRGEWKWSEWKWNSIKLTFTCNKAITSYKRWRFCSIFIPLYVILIGGAKAIRYVIMQVMINPITSDSLGFSEKETSYFFILIFIGTVIGSLLIFVLQYLRFKSYELNVVGFICTILGFMIMTDWQAIGHDPCTDYSLFHHPNLADEYRVQLVKCNVSESGLVSVQSLQVVEDDVYQMAVNRCESAGDHCHWIPNSQVTHKHCSDCHPICRSTQHTLNLPQFIIGLSLLVSTFPLMYTGVFLLLSDNVGKEYQGISSGSMATMMGLLRTIAPLWLVDEYERAQKRTYLPFLTVVGLYLPLLVGLLLLYPWIAGRHRNKKSDQPHHREEGSEHTKLLPVANSHRESD